MPTLPGHIRIHSWILPSMRVHLAYLIILLCMVASLGAADLGPVNSICPVTGRPVDPAIPAVMITMGKGEHAARLVIAVADAASAEKVKANPEFYIAAAKANRQADAR
jgi:hypothetical protein